jgi:hypothetical protein
MDQQGSREARSRARRRRPVGDRKSPKPLARSWRVAAAALFITIAADLAQAPGRPRVELNGNVTMEARCGRAVGCSIRATARAALLVPHRRHDAVASDRRGAVA